MNKPRLALIALISGALLVGVLGGLLYTGPCARPANSRGPKLPLVYRWQAYLKEHFPQPISLRLDVTGTAGTPVVVGYSIDGHQAGIFRGVIPTNFTVRARRRVGVAIKNLGSNFPELGFSFSGPVQEGVQGSFRALFRHSMVSVVRCIGDQKKAGRAEEEFCTRLTGRSHCRPA